MEQPQKPETSNEKEPLGFNRYDVLSRLWDNSTWLQERRELKQLKITPALSKRVYMVQVQCSVCKTILSGLKDRELDDLMKEIEAIKEHIGMKT